MEPVEGRVKKIIVDQLGVEEDLVTPEASFVDDLGADSLDTVELVMALEEEFGIEIPGDAALKDSGIKIGTDVEAERVGTYIGSGIGGFATIEEEHRTLLERGPRKVSPFFIPASIVNLAAGWVSIRAGAKGPNSATCTA